MTTVESTVSDAIAEARAQWGQRRHVIAALSGLLRVSQTTLGKRMGMSRQVISDRLTGKTEIPWEELAGFAVALGVPRHVLDMAPDEAAIWVATNQGDRFRTGRFRCRFTQGCGFDTFSDAA